MAAGVGGRADGASRTLPVYVAAAAFFAAIAARGFLVPLRAHELGADRLTVGLLFTVITLAAAALSLPAGLLADRFGRRGMVVVSGLTGAGSQLAIGLSPSIPLDFAWQVVGGVGGGAAQAALFAAVADAVPAGRLGRAMGWLTLSMQVGFLAGPALAGLLLGLTDLRGDLLLTSALYAIALATAIRFPAQRRSHAAGWNLVAPIREMATRTGFYAVIVGLFGATLLWGTVQAYLPIFAQEQLRLPGTYIGYLLALQAVSNGVSRIPGGRLIDLAPVRGPIVAGGVIGYAAAVLLLPHLGGFWAPALLLAAAIPMLATAFVAIGVSFSALAPPDRLGAAMGVYGAVLFLGLAIGPAVFGGVMDRSGYTAGFTTCGAAAIVISLLMLITRAHERRARRPAVVLPPPAPGT